MTYGVGDMTEADMKAAKRVKQAAYKASFVPAASPAFMQAAANIPKSASSISVVNPVLPPPPAPPSSGFTLVDGIKIAAALYFFFK